MRMPSNGRGLPPVIRTDTVLAYVLDDESGNVGRNRAGDFVHLGQLGAVSTGTVLTGRTRKARSFTGSQILDVAATQRVIDVLLATSWTVTCALRVDVDGSGDDFAFSVGGGATGAGTPGTNTLMAVGFNVREPFLYWESGAGGTSRFGRLTGYDLSFGMWALLAFRRTSATAVAAFVNGEQFATLDMVAANAGGAVGTTYVNVGAMPNAARTAASVGMTGRVACCYVDAGLRTDEEIATDFRRFVGLDKPTSVHVKVEVENGLASLVDLTDPELMGADFVNEVRIRENFDDPCATIDVSVARNIGNLSAAPLRTDSKLNLEDVLDPTTYNPHLYGYREIVASVARVPLFCTPAASDFWERFRGRIDVVDDGDGENVALRARDQGGYLIDKQIDEPRVYPQTFGGGGCGASAQAREIVMQEIIDDNGGLATLQTPVSPNSCRVVGDPPEIPRGSLLQTLRVEAGSIGWDCKYRWDPVSETFALTFYEPGRDKVIPDVLLTRDDVVSVNGGEQSLADVRTRVSVTSNDSATLNTEGQPLPATYTAIDAVAEAAFDERAMAIIEDATRGIDTSTERQRMAEAVLADVSTLRRTGSTLLAPVPELEAQDYVRFNGNGLHYTAEQKVGARTVEHTFAKEKTSTRLQAEGQPAAGFKRWLDLEAGRAGPLPLRSPADALKERLSPGMVEGVLEFVARSAYPGGSKFINVKNGDFARFTKGDAYPPDAWSMAAGTWATDVGVETSVLLSGGRAINILTSTGQLRSDYVPINGQYDFPYSFEAVWQWKTGATPGSTTKRLEMVIEWYTEAKVLISSSTVRAGGTAYPPGQWPDASSIANATWFVARVDGISPPPAGTARFMRVILKLDTNGSHTVTHSPGLLVDSLTAYRTAREDRTFLLTPYTIVGGTSNAWYAINLRSPHLSLPPANNSHDWGHNHFEYDSGAGGTIIKREDGTDEVISATFFASGFYCKEPGTYLVTAQALLLYNPAGSGTTTPPMMARVVKNATYTSSTNQANTGGTVVAQATGGQNMAAPTYDATLFGGGGFANGIVAVVALSFRVELVRGDRLTFEFWRGEDPGAGTTVIIPVADFQHTWWNVRLGLAE